MNNLQVQQTHRTLIIAISTRSAGFIIREMIAKLIKLEVIQPEEGKILAGALYRITLLQIDNKLDEAKLIQHSSNLEVETYVQDDVRRSIEFMGAGFSPLINYISAIGYVKTAAKCYLPRHPKVSTILSPLYQRASTLRETVERLSNPETPLNIKRSFMENSPFPNAVWQIQPGLRNAAGEKLPEDIRLANPDDIMPADYSVADVRQDVTDIKTAVEKVGLKYPNYVSPRGIDWRGQGSVAQLVSNYPANICCPTWPTTGAVTSISGVHSEYWIPEIISDPEAYMGVVYMLGEVDRTSLTIPACSALRSKYSAYRELYLEYASVMQSSLNQCSYF